MRNHLRCVFELTFADLNHATSAKERKTHIHTYGLNHKQRGPHVTSKLLAEDDSIPRLTCDRVQSLSIWVQGKTKRFMEPNATEPSMKPILEVQTAQNYWCQSSEFSLHLILLSLFYLSGKFFLYRIKLIS